MSEKRTPQGAMLQIFVKHHSTHLLARHGELSDQEHIKRLLTQSRLPSTDALLRHVVYAGLALTGRHPDIVREYLRELKRDDSLRAMNIAFNAIHYGDVDIESHTLPQVGLRAPRSAITHVLRHILRPDYYENIRPVEEHTIGDIFELFGESVFCNGRLLELLRRCLLLEYGHAQVISLTPSFRATSTSIVRHCAIRNVASSLESVDLPYTLDAARAMTHFKV